MRKHVHGALLPRASLALDFLVVKRADTCTYVGRYGLKRQRLCQYGLPLLSVWAPPLCTLANCHLCTQATVTGKSHERKPPHKSCAMRKNEIADSRTMQPGAPLQTLQTLQSRLDAHKAQAPPVWSIAKRPPLLARITKISNVFLSWTRTTRLDLDRAGDIWRGA